MKYLGKLLIVLLLGIAIFGTFNMHNMMQTHDTDCVAATVNDTDCPKQFDSLNFLSFHLEAYTSFFLAVFVSTIALIFLVFFSVYTDKYFRARKQLLLNHSFKDPPLPNQKIKLYHWLALLFYSPTLN